MSELLLFYSFIFFHLENIITKISLVNEPPYKMAKPASLYPGYQRVFFSSRAVGCFGVGQRPKIFGRRPVDLQSRGSQFKELSETAHEKSLAPTVKTL